MNKEEKEAREICAWCNWVKECKDCPRVYWHTGKIKKVPSWNYIKCEQWKHYLKKPHEKFIRKLRKFLRLHNWFKDVKYSPVRIVRTCIICEKRQEFKSNKDYTKGKWVNID